MIRLLLSIIILTLLTTYAIVPFIKYLVGFSRKETKRIDKEFDKAFNNNEKDDI